MKFMLLTLFLTVFLSACNITDPGTKRFDSSLFPDQSMSADASTPLGDSWDTSDPPKTANEDVSTEYLVRYRGKLGGRNYLTSTNLVYDIRMYGVSSETGEQGNRICSIEYIFKNKETGCVQRFTYDLEDFWIDPNTFRWGLQVLDINWDGYDDFILDLGVSGKMTIAECYVYDSQQDEMVLVEGFDLMSPSISFESTGEPVIIAWDAVGNDLTPDGYDEGLSKYRVEGNQLILLSTVRYNYEGEGVGYRYTVTDYTSGKPVQIAERISYEEFLSLSWYGIRLTSA